MTTAEQLYTSLLDPLAFPPFLSCPHEDIFSSTYYDQGRSTPIRHWCFLGEIENISGIGRLCLDVRDRDGTAVRIYFYLDRLSPSVVEIIFTVKGHEITYPRHPNCPQHLIQKGNTIAVLYAQQHPWRESSTGIRIEEGDTVHFFPYKLDQLLSLGEQILQGVPPSKESAELRACNRCGKKSGFLMCCSACRIAWYCSRNCQKIDWSTNGHNKNCKTSQVKLMMKQKWSRFDAYLKFPLFAE